MRHDNGTGNNHNHRKRGGCHADRSRLDDAAGNVRCVFNVFGCDIRKAIHSIYKNMELLESETKRYIKQDNGINYDVYSLEMVIAVSFKLRSRESVAFRRFIMGRLTMNNRQPVNLFFSLSHVAWKESGKLSRPQTAYEIPSNGV